jgi:hypothetical protein
MEKRILFVAAILLILYSSSFSWAQEPGTPNMIIPDKIYDAGEVDEGTVIEHTFKVMNQGDGLLKVRDVKPTCGCSVANFDRAVPPGGEGKIYVKTKKVQKGRKRDRIRVYTNDPANSREILTITAFVRPIINVEPDKSVYYMVGKPGETKSTVINISGREGRPLILKEKFFDLTGIVDYQVETVEENRIYNVSIQNIPNTNDNFRGHLKFKTNYPEKPEIKFCIRGRFVNR